MKRIYVMIIGIALCSTSFAQVAEKDTSYWTNGGIFNANFSQVGLNNWSAGGENSLSLTTIFAPFSNYEKGGITWDNSLELTYGILKQGERDVQKSDDKIDFTSKFGKKANNIWHYSALLNAKTQFTKGYANPGDSLEISDFISPAYLLFAVGMDYKPNKKFSALLSPLTYKGTYVGNHRLANAGAFGVDKAVLDTAGNVVTPGANLRNEFGASAFIAYKTTVMENVTFSTKLGLFTNYTENPQNVDVSWETLLNMKVNKYITASISTQLLYDDDIVIEVDDNNDGITDGAGPRTQFKEVIGVGVAFKF